MSLWVLGTDTSVGKTIVSALVLSRYRGRAQLAYWKPVSTGGDRDRDRSTVASLTGADVDLLDETYLFELPASPHLAARREDAEINPNSILRDLERFTEAAPSREMVIEGAGGVLVPLTDRGSLYVDTIAATGLPAVVVARSTLGTINHTLLTLEALGSRDIEVVGVVLNGPPDLENRSAIERFGATPVIAEVPPLSASWSGGSGGGPLGRPAIAGAAGGFDPDGVLGEHLGVPR